MRIKERPEDFVVEEMIVLDCSGGYYSYWQLKKTNLNTLEAVQRIAEKLGIPFKYIKYAGNKDKRAVTTQYISIYKAAKERVRSLQDLELSFVGLGKEPIHLGQHHGNIFRITVRDAEDAELNISPCPNYFGTQRFSKNNVEVGRAIIKREWSKAAHAVSNKDVQEYLRVHPHDYVGALKQLPKQLLRLYIHSYQSHMWNKTAKRCIAECELSFAIPIIGFGTGILDDDISKIVKEVIQEENIVPRDFIIRELPEFSSEGGERELWMQVTDLKLGRHEPDELHHGKKKMVVEFTLPKGSYATVLIEHLFSV